MYQIDQGVVARSLTQLRRDEAEEPDPTGERVRVINALDRLAGGSADVDADTLDKVERFMGLLSRSSVCWPTVGEGPLQGGDQ